MRQLKSSLRTVTSLFLLGALFITFSSSTAPNFEALQFTDDISHLKPLLDYDICELEAPQAIACSRYIRHSRINCGCAPGSPGNSSSTYTFHKDKYKRTCWIVGSSQISWTEYTPWVCNWVCQ